MCGESSIPLLVVLTTIYIVGISEWILQSLVMFVIDGDRNVLVTAED